MMDDVISLVNQQIIKANSIRVIKLVNLMILLGVTKQDSDNPASLSDTDIYLYVLRRNK